MEFGRIKWELEHALSRVHSKRSPLVHLVLIPMLIDPLRFWQIYSKSTHLLLNWSMSWIIWKTNIKKNQDNLSPGQPLVHAGIYGLPQCERTTGELACKFTA